MFSKNVVENSTFSNFFSFSFFDSDERKKSFYNSTSDPGASSNFCSFHSGNIHEENIGFELFSLFKIKLRISLEVL